MGRDEIIGDETAGGGNLSGVDPGNSLGPTRRLAGNAAGEFLSGLDAAAAGREAFDRRLGEAVAARESGWIGLRVKLAAGVVRAVQFTLDQQFPVDEPDGPADSR